MKSLFILSLLMAAQFSHAADVQKFVRSSLIPYRQGPGDFAQPWFKDRCDEAEQARAKQSAQEAAQADCEKADGVKDCLVKFSRITINGALPENLLNKYGLHTGGDGYGYWGCEAESLVYGLSD